MSNNEVKTNSSGHQKGSSIMASTVIPVTDVYIDLLLVRKVRQLKVLRKNIMYEFEHLMRNQKEGHLHPCVRITGNHDNVDKAARWIRSIIAQHL